MQEWLDATLADDVDSANNRPTNGSPTRHVDASNPRNRTQTGMAVLFERQL
jgi:hypothetical protein